jgi:hypothetical protein
MNQSPPQIDLVNHFRYIKNKTTTFVPQEDSFITTAGNPTLGAKYGNDNCVNNINTHIIRQSVLSTFYNLNNNSSNR